MLIPSSIPTKFRNARGSWNDTAIPISGVGIGVLEKLIPKLNAAKLIVSPSIPKTFCQGTEVPSASRPMDMLMDKVPVEEKEIAIRPGT